MECELLSTVSIDSSDKITFTLFLFCVGALVFLVEEVFGFLALFDLWMGALDGDGGRLVTLDGRGGRGGRESGSLILDFQTSGPHLELDGEAINILSFLLVPSDDGSGVTGVGKSLLDSRLLPFRLTRLVVASSSASNMVLIPVSP